MGMAVTFVMTLASLMTWLVEHFLLVPLNLMYMRTIAFILVIAVLVQLVEMALKNCAQTLSHETDKTGREIAALDELAKTLGMETPPSYIEAYDISNFGAATKVAGMVVFENGKPLRSAYKKFTIKTVEGTDDYASMQEVIGRRLAR